jgi:hypothetical protein|tara:strand:+ start:140 stop:358 length:219 start_codon:yes stop_codon:yes gene_type:complete
MKCLLCGGLGYVRVCTTRVEPDFSASGKDSMPADYDPYGLGLPKTPNDPLCELDEDGKSVDGSDRTWKPTME